MFSLLLAVHPNIRVIGKISSRAASFKILKSELNYNDTDWKNAEIKSNSVRTILNNLFNFARAGGGSKGIHRHTVINKKLLVRERLRLLFDSDSPFLEIGLLGGMCMDYGTIPAATSVTAIGKIHGHYCIVGANDGTVKGGTFFPISVTKQLRMQQLSYLNHLPCIYLVDSGGAYLPLQADIFPDKNHGGRTFYNEAVLSSLGIPQIALVCGSCTAGGAYCPTMAEEAIIIKGSGTIFLAGPPLVKAATGEEVSEQDLGGAHVHCSVSGCTDYFAETEEEAFEMCRESVLALNMTVPPSFIFYKEPLYPATDLSLLSAKACLNKSDMYDILSRILDGSMFKEFKGQFGKNLILGFGYIHGILVGTVANCSSLTYQDGEKGAHFIQLCQKRGIPLLFLQNSGNECELSEEENLSMDVLRDRAKMVSAVSCAEVPKISINVGGCYADDNYTMCSFDFEPNFFFSWPLAHISLTRSVTQVQGQKDDVLNKLAQMKDVGEYELLFEDSSSAFYRASRMLSDGVIHPEDTRQVLAMCLKIARGKIFSATQITKNLHTMFRM